MRLTVALDTATEVASIAVGRDGRVLAEIALAGRRHASALLPALEEAVRLAGGSWRDVGRMLCADGPGSFTGLRIGFATVQGIVRARPEVTVGTLPSLLASAWVAVPWANGPVAAIYDALRGEVFGAVYRFEPEGVVPLVPPQRLPLGDLIARCPEQAALAVGEGAVLHLDAITAWTGRPPVGPPAGGPRAAALIALDGVVGGIRALPDVVTFEPDYGRPAEAQARWERAHGRALPDSGGDFR
jgi:tRNA threonylcarbamoyladenosine biosynthesis protein TsaB